MLDKTALLVSVRQRETNLMSSRLKRLIDGGDFGFDNVGIATSW